MRFKSGDVCQVIRARIFPQMLGRIFTLTKPCVVYPGAWDTDPPQRAPNYALPISFYEKALRKLDNPGDDEVDQMLERLGRPSGAKEVQLDAELAGLSRELQRLNDAIRETEKELTRR